jgi:hypothetical protein
MVKKRKDDRDQKNDFWRDYEALTEEQIGVF